ncbi:MAG: tRNA (adenosine(37)-N6)-threonylcarbamoyltransferase complex dimerization subunit type 1 TsaB [Candidatus Kapaibacterium sp.]
MIPHTHPQPSSVPEPPRLLAIETSGIACGVAMSVGSRIVASHSHHVPHVHDRLLAGMVERMMSDHAVTWQDIDAVAVSAGPGSFTGLRIGVSLAKALCSSGLPRLVGVPTMVALATEAVARGVSRDHARIVTAYASQRGQLYTQAFDIAGAALTEPVLISSERFPEMVTEGTLVCSTDVLPDLHMDSVMVIPLRAEFLVPVALGMLKHGQVHDSDRFVPLYVQDFVPKSA